MTVSADLEIETAVSELHDAFARVRAQIHVLKLAMPRVEDERDIRSLISSLNAMSDELTQAEGLLKH
ncbi:hypothetical protein [Aestuariivirga sp.]|uniref:hypothetical protein n=1 Tax=Aestuariivirga sp. TaxID=2650926 RepID=UPI003BACA37D